MSLFTKFFFIIWKSFNKRGYRIYLSVLVFKRALGPTFKRIFNLRKPSDEEEEEIFSRRGKNFQIKVDSREDKYQLYIWGRLLSPYLGIIKKNMKKFFPIDYFDFMWELQTEFNKRQRQVALTFRGLRILRYKVLKKMAYENLIAYLPDKDVYTFLGDKRQLLLRYSTIPGTNETIWSDFSFINLKKATYDFLFENSYPWLNTIWEIPLITRIGKVIYINNKFIFLRKPIFLPYVIGYNNFLSLSPWAAYWYKNTEIPEKELIKLDKIINGFFHTEPTLYNINLNNQISITYLLGYYAWRPVYETIIIYKYDYKSFTLNAVVRTCASIIANIIYFILVVLAFEKTTPRLHKMTAIKKLVTTIKKLGVKRSVNRLFKIKEEPKHMLKRKQRNKEYYIKYPLRVLRRELYFIITLPIKLPYWILKYLIILTFRSIVFTIRTISQLLQRIDPEKVLLYSGHYIYAYITPVTDKFRFTLRLLRQLQKYLISKLIVIITAKPSFLDKKNTISEFLSKYIIAAFICIVFILDINYTNVLVTVDTTPASFMLILALVFLIIMAFTPFRQDVLNSFYCYWLVILAGIIVPNTIYLSKKGLHKEFMYPATFSGGGFKKNVWEDLQIININWTVFLLLFVAICIYAYFDYKNEHLVDMYVDDIYTNEENQVNERYSKRIIYDLFMNKDEVTELKEYEKWISFAKPTILFDARENPYDHKHFTELDQDEYLIVPLRDYEIYKLDQSIKYYKREQRREIFKRRLARELYIPYEKKNIILTEYRLDLELLDEAVFEEEEDYYDDEVYEEIMSDIAIFNLVNLNLERRLKTVRKKNKTLLDKYRILFNDWGYLEDDSFLEFILHDDAYLDDNEDTRWGIIDSIVDKKLDITKLKAFTKELPLKQKHENITAILEISDSNVGILNTIPVKLLFYCLRMEQKLIKQGFIPYEDIKIGHVLVEFDVLDITGWADEEITFYYIENPDRGMDYKIVEIGPTSHVSISLPDGQVLSPSLTIVEDALRNDYELDETQLYLNAFPVMVLDMVVLDDLLDKGVIGVVDVIKRWNLKRQAKYFKKVVYFRRSRKFGHNHFSLLELRGKLKPNLKKKLELFKKIWNKFSEK